MATLDVSDEGPGMTADEQERVFERFYRGDPSRSRASGGTGLGLSIAAAIVRAHGGTIGVRNTDGGGATFRITIPLLGTPAPQAGEPGEPAKAEPAKAEPGDLAEPTAPTVEDEPVDVSLPEPERT
jgi:two-component system OmpR family sensor kinase